MTQLINWIVPASVGDLQARSYYTNISVVNAERSCSSCEIWGTAVQKGAGHCRTFLDEQNIVQKTNESIKANAKIGSPEMPVRTITEDTHFKIKH